MLLHDDRGPFLALSPAEAQEACAALVAAGIAFEEDSESGAGCAGPEVVVLRFPGRPDGNALGSEVESALEGLGGS